MGDLHPWYVMNEEACREEMAEHAAPAAKLEVAMGYYNRDYITRAQLLRLIDEPLPCSTSDQAKK